MAMLRGRVLAAYLIVCIVWGSTYLAIRVGVSHVPPFLFAGVRFLTAGVLLGVAESLCSYLLDSGLTLAVAYFLFLVVLLVRPRGLFGTP